MKCEACASGWPFVHQDRETGEHFDPNPGSFTIVECAAHPLNQPGNNPVPCFVCGKGLDLSLGGGTRDIKQQGYVRNQPSDGTAFDTTGNYGSTMFDSMEGDKLEIAICDECFRPRSARCRILRHQHSKAVPGWEYYRREPERQRK